MSAAENKWQLRRAMSMIKKAVGDGAAAMVEANEALVALESARMKMENSRIHALQELGEVRRIIDLVTPVAAGSNNHTIEQGLGMLHQTREQLEAYVNSMVYRTTNVSKMANQLREHVSGTLDSSGMAMQVAALDIQEYSQQL